MHVEVVYIEITSLHILVVHFLISLSSQSFGNSSTMKLFQFFTIPILLLSITSVNTYSVPYQSIQLPFSITPKLIYTSETNPTFSGYSYTTQDFNGGESNVVFTMGVDSMNRLKNEINSIRSPEEYSERDKNQENIISLEKQSKSVKAGESKNIQDDSNIEVFNEEKKFSKDSEANNLIEHQTNLQEVSLVDIPYPALRENLLNLYLPEFPRYQIASNVIQSQYYPYNPYARLELPLNNLDLYNPVPLFYQAAAIVSDSSSKSTATAVKNEKVSVKSHVTKSTQKNVTSSESGSIKSNVIESRVNLESTTNTIEETPSNQSISMKKFESMITSEKIKEKISSTESAATSQNSIEQTTDNKASSTEFISTEMNTSTKKPCIT